MLLHDYYCKSYQLLFGTPVSICCTSVPMFRRGLPQIFGQLIFMQVQFFLYFINVIHNSGLHKLRARLRSCTLHARKRCCTHTKNSCTVLILLCKNNLNLPMCLSFFHHAVMLAPSLRCADFLFLFLRKSISSPSHKPIISQFI